MASTTEPKGEIQEVTEEVLTETLSYKTWVLKISIHCAACSKKVTKILKKIDGVYLTQVDFVQQRVTVIGNVEAETLIKQLSKKTTKHVELLWPEPKANSTSNDKAKKQSKPKENEKQGDQAAIPEEPKTNHAGGGGGGGKKKKGKEHVKEEVVEVKVEAVGSGVRNKKFEVGSSSNSKGVVEEAEDVKPHEGGGGKGKEAQPVAAEKERVGVESETVGEQSGGGNKKKGKGQKGSENVSAEGEVVGGDAPPSQPGPQPRPRPQPHGPVHVASAMPNVLRPAQGPPPQVYEQHPYYWRQQQFDQYPYARQQQHFASVHAMNYHAAHPGISFGAARYAAPPAYSQTHTYAHWVLGNEVDPRGDHMDNLPAPQPPSLPATQLFPPHPYDTSNSDNYAFFSDENPNGCSIM